MRNVLIIINLERVHTSARIWAQLYSIVKIPFRNPGFTDPKSLKFSRCCFEAMKQLTHLDKFKISKHLSNRMNHFLKSLQLIRKQIHFKMSLIPARSILVDRKYYEGLRAEVENLRRRNRSQEQSWASHKAQLNKGWYSYWKIRS